MGMTERPVSGDAAIVLALAGTAIPFAHSPEDEAEHWLRILRMHGEVGRALQALGVGERPLQASEEPDTPFQRSRPGQRGRRGGENVVELVSARASEEAAARNARAVSTGDVLSAVFAVYGQIFDDVLYAHGATREELLDRLGRGALANQE
jgi:hypothetical protein